MQRRAARLLVYCLLGGALVSGVAACGGSGSPPASTPTGDVARWVQQERLPPAAVPGAAVFKSAGCTACHVYAGSGRTNLAAPDLTAYGRLHRGTAFYLRFLRCPSCVISDSPMPPFGALGRKQLRELAVFLEASKGIQ